MKLKSYIFRGIEIEESKQSIIFLEMLFALFSCLLISMSEPTIKIWMVSHVNPIYYKVSIIIECIIGIIINMLIGKDSLQKLKRYFVYICLLDSILMFIINLIVTDDANIRFIILSISYPLITALMIKIIIDVYNNLTSGSSLTILGERRSGINKLGFIAGVIISMIIEIDLNTALILQLLGIIIETFSSIFIRKRLMK